jgi:hypothetical protein
MEGEGGVFGWEGGEEEPNDSWGRNEWSAGSVEHGRVAVEHNISTRVVNWLFVANCRTARVLIEVLVLI